MEPGGGPEGQGDRLIMRSQWQPSLGAWPGREGTHFRVWAPEAQSVALLLGPSSKPHPLERQADGTWSLYVPGCGAGTLYRYLIDGRGPFPAPASRFQPQGLHGP